MQHLLTHLKPFINTPICLFIREVITYKGRYIPTNPKKYKGDPSRIIYRSLWERKLMVYCDRNEKVLEWGSEEVIIPYLSPWDNKIHRYFPDFI